jgi:hypothetical protein
MMWSSERQSSLMKQGRKAKGLQGLQWLQMSQKFFNIKQQVHRKMLHIWSVHMPFPSTWNRMKLTCVCHLWACFSKFRARTSDSWNPVGLPATYVHFGLHRQPKGMLILLAISYPGVNYFIWNITIFTVCCKKSHYTIFINMHRNIYFGENFRHKE